VKRASHARSQETLTAGSPKSHVTAGLQMRPLERAVYKLRAPFPLWSLDLHMGHQQHESPGPMGSFGDGGTELCQVGL
jgi:hypothetical protein